MKAIDKILKENGNLRVGNHRIEWTFNDAGHEIANYYYHDTIICQVNTNQCTVSYDNGGYDTRSTNTAINCYKRYFKDYAEVSR